MALGQGCKDMARKIVQHKSLIYGLLEGWDIIDCLEFGSASASMLVASHSCSDAMPTVEEIKEFIRKSKEEYGEMVAKL